MEELKTIHLFAIFLSLIGHSSTKLKKSVECEYYANERVHDLRLKGFKCLNADLMRIPSHFPTDINCLEIEGDNIENLTVNAFKRYPKLKYLTLKRVGLLFIEETTFSSMKELVHLDLSHNKFSPSSFPFLPPYLETLILSGMKEALLFDPQTEDRMRRVKKTLKRLVLRQNFMWTLPSWVAEMYSLTEIDVDGNGMSRIRPVEFASLCNLKSFSFDKNDFPSDIDGVCQCLFVWNWAKMKSIEMVEYFCPDIKVSKCPGNRTAELEEAETAFQQCRNNAQGVHYLYYTALPAIMILAIVIGWFAWRKFRAFCCASTKSDKARKMLEEEVALGVASSEPQ